MDGPTNKELLDAMDRDVVSLRRVAELVMANRSAIARLAGYRSKAFAANPQKAESLAVVIRDVLDDFAHDLGQAAAMAREGDVDVRSAVVYPNARKH